MAPPGFLLILVDSDRGAPFLCPFSQYLWLEVALFDVHAPTEVDIVVFIEQLIMK